MINRMSSGRWGQPGMMVMPVNQAMPPRPAMPGDLKHPEDEQVQDEDIRKLNSKTACWPLFGIICCFFGPFTFCVGCCMGGLFCTMAGKGEGGKPVPLRVRKKSVEDFFGLSCCAFWTFANCAVWPWILWIDSGVCFYQIRTKCGECIPLRNEGVGSNPMYGTNPERDKLVTSHKQSIKVQKRRRLSEAAVKANAEALERDGFLSSYQPSWKLFENEAGDASQRRLSGGGNDNTKEIQVVTTRPKMSAWTMAEDLIWPEVSTENCAYGSGHIIPAEVLTLSTTPGDPSNTTPYISDAGNTMLTGGSDWTQPEDSHVSDQAWIFAAEKKLHWYEHNLERTYLDPETYGEFLYPVGDSRQSRQKTVPTHQNREGQWYFTAWDTAVRGPFTKTDHFGLTSQEFPEHLELYCGRKQLKQYTEEKCQEICDCLDGYLYSHDWLWMLFAYGYTFFCVFVCICPCYINSLKTRIDGIQTKVYGHTGNFSSGGVPMVAAPMVVQQQPMMMMQQQPAPAPQQNINITVNTAGNKVGGNSAGETCAKCANEYTEDAQFCRKCGHPRGMPA